MRKADCDRAWAGVTHGWASGRKAGAGGCQQGERGVEHVKTEPLLWRVWLEHGTLSLPACFFSFLFYF